MLDDLSNIPKLIAKAVIRATRFVEHLPGVEWNVNSDDTSNMIKPTDLKPCRVYGVITELAGNCIAWCKQTSAALVHNPTTAFMWRLVT